MTSADLEVGRIIKIPIPCDTKLPKNL